MRSKERILKKYTDPSEHTGEQVVFNVLCLELLADIRDILHEIKIKGATHD